GHRVDGGGEQQQTTGDGLHSAQFAPFDQLRRRKVLHYTFLPRERSAGCRMTDGYGRVGTVREPVLVPRLQPFTSTIFAEMTALATRTGAVNLGQGFPHTDRPPGMLTAAQEAIASGVNQYPPGPGRPELRSAIAEHRTRFGQSFDPDTEV